MKKLNVIIDWILNCVLIIFGFVSVWFLLQVFFFTSFRIPSDSMEPELVAGDFVFVNKLLMGPRLFNLSASMKGEQVDIYRLSGLQKLHRDDVLVFNFPHPDRWDKIEMHIMKYYIKRCIGLPGDTLSIENGFYRVDGVKEELGNRNSQERIARMREFANDESSKKKGKYQFSCLNISVSCLNIVLYRCLLRIIDFRNLLKYTIFTFVVDDSLFA